MATKRHEKTQEQKGRISSQPANNFDYCSAKTTGLWTTDAGTFGSLKRRQRIATEDRGNAERLRHRTSNR
jgi:hypothetical protein